MSSPMVTISGMATVPGEPFLMLGQTAVEASKCSLKYIIMLIALVVAKH